MPHLALPVLTAYLKKHGVPVEQRDLNVEAFDWLLTPSSLGEALQAVQSRYRQLEGLNRRTARQAAELNHLEEVLFRAEELVEDIELAKQILRGAAFYEPDENLGAMLTVMDALELAAAPYFPAALGWYGYETPQSPESSQGIVDAVRAPETNLFRDFYQRTILRDLAQDTPDLIGISISSIHQVIPGFTLAAMIKERDPGIHITLGGKMITCWRRQLPKKPRLFDFFDSAVYHDGEEALVSLVEFLSGQRDLEDVPNLIYRDGDEILINELFVFEKTDDLPHPDFDGLPLEKYLAPEIILPVQACRGCYWQNCAFCNLGYGQSRDWRPRAAEHVVDEMAALQERYGTRFFFLVDEALPPSLLRAMTCEIKSRNLEIRWSGCARFEKALDADLLQDLFFAGCRVLNYGLESGSQRILDRMTKGTDLHDVSRILREGAEAGIWNHIFVFFGFPGETEGDAEKTQQFIEEHLDAIQSIAGGTFVMEKYSEVWRHPRAYDVSRIISQPQDDLAFRYAYQVSRGQNAVEAQESLRRFSERLDTLRQPRVFFFDVYNLLYASHFDDPSLLARRPE